MEGDHKNEHCMRQLGPGECLVAEAGLTRGEWAVLTTARFFFKAFSEPGSEAWIRAMATARCCFGDVMGSQIAAAVLDVARQMRLSRRTMFRFSNPECPGCSGVMCEAERQLMGVICATNRGQKSEAHAHALLLCEGNDTSAMLEAVSELSGLFPAEPTQTRQRERVC